MKLTFVTGNPDKAKEIEAHIGYPVAQAALDLYEVQSLDIREIIEAKAREAYTHLQTPVLVDDAGLALPELGGLPGPLVKWFIKTISNEGICRLADQSKERKALAQVAIGYFDGDNFVPFIAEIPGHISELPLGQGGYGWDAIFIQEGESRTRSELSPEEYLANSYRKPLLDNLKSYLLTRA